LSSVSLDHRSAGVHLTTLLAVRLAPSGEPEGPLVQLHPAFAERIVLAWIGAGDEAVQ
jgi:hypothetical protein